MCVCVHVCGWVGVGVCVNTFNSKNMPFDRSGCKVRCWIGVCIRERKTETSADRQTDRQAGRHGRGLLHTVTARVWCRGGIDRKRNSAINLTTDSGACF